MKIIRYCNGKKIEKQFLTENVVTNQLIAGTIAQVNKRISKLDRKENI